MSIRIPSGCISCWAKSFEARREIPSAIEEYKQALERQPEAPGLNYALANLYWKEGSLEEAEKGFKKGIGTQSGRLSGDLETG